MSSRSSVDRASARCSGGHGFDSCPGIRFFLCPTLVSLLIISSFASIIWLVMHLLAPVLGLKGVGVRCRPLIFFFCYFIHSQSVSTKIIPNGGSFPFVWASLFKNGQNLLPYLRWPNTVFLYLCVSHRYFETTGSWAAKIGKLQVQLKKIRFWYVLLDLVLLPWQQSWN